MTDQAGTAPAPRRRRLKAKAAPAAAAAPPTDDGGLKPAVRAAVLAKHVPASAGEQDGVKVVTSLAPRHFEWLLRFATKEGRTVSQALERIVRVACANDPTKGFAPAELGAGQAVPAGTSAPGGTGVSGRHPAVGSER